MAGTPTLIDRVLTRLTDDVAFSAYVVGGIFDRELKRQGPGATPTAYATTPPYPPRIAAVVADAGDTADVFGPDTAFLGFLHLWFYAPRTHTGRSEIATAADMARTLLHRWRTAMPNGTGAELKLADRLGTHDDPDDDGRALDRLRFQVNGIHVVT